MVEKLADNQLRKDWDRQEWRAAEPRVAKIFTEFLKRAESVKINARATA